MDKYASLYLVNILAPPDSAVSLKDSDAIMDQQVRMDLTTKAIGGFKISERMQK